MKVLVAIDGSECSQAVVDHCIKNNWANDTVFKVVSVTDVFEPLPALKNIKDSEIKKAQVLVEDCAKQIMNKFPNLKVSFQVLDGYVKSALIDSAMHWPADLIIVGSHGRTGFQKLLLGSVSQAVTVHSACSVRVVKKVQTNQNRPFEVLICLEKSKFSEKALENLLNYEWPEKCRFTLVSVAFKLPENITIPDTAKFNLEEAKKARMKEAQSILDGAEEKIKESFGNKVEINKIVKIGDAREEILSVAEELEPDLIMVGSHGRAIFDRMLMGSVSDAIVHLAKCPVEIVKV